MRSINLTDKTLLKLGLGTWHMGEGDAQKTQDELEALRLGIDVGMRVVDTAEMYGDGKAETLVGKAIKPYVRQSLYLVSKFYPWHATASQIRQALEASLKRLGTDYLDLYLLHWRSDVPFEETIDGLQAVQKAGLIRNFGVSNFDVADLTAFRSCLGGDELAANEVLYNVQARGIEYDLIPYQKENHIPLITYSPFGSGDGTSIHVPQAVVTLAEAKDLSVHQLLLGWTLRHQGTITLVKSASMVHLRDNFKALDVTFTPDELAMIDAAFPKPTGKVPLETI